EDVTHGAARDPLERDPSIFGIGVEDPEEPRSAELDGEARFPLEVLSVATAPMVDLEGDLAAEQLVFGFVHDTRAAARDLTQKTEGRARSSIGDDGRFIEATRGTRSFSERGSPASV